ncbi:zinc finger and SCAN domain-containing protein 4-like [Saccopteryx bilineata]|uniref:zinc finger and SCAN domain-containing protein 4-like n=1 Tax=Saccopteryx bilineata TaxID=59482 RepID=UPI00338D439C
MPLDIRISMLRKKNKEIGIKSERNLETFMEDASDDCMKPPDLVHIHMQGQKALFFFPLHFESGLQPHTDGPMLRPPDFKPATSASQSIQTPSLLIQEENCLGPEERGVSMENPLSSRRASLGIPRSQEGSLKGRTLLSRCLCLTCGGTVNKASTCNAEVAWSRHHHGQSTYKKANNCCNEELMLLISPYLYLSVSLTKNKQKKTWRWDQCSYVCSLYQRNYHQSSTYHGHLRTPENCLQMCSSTPGASSM